MDRNNIIGFILIALLLFVYFTFFAPQPVPPAVNPLPAKDSVTSSKPDTFSPNSDTVLNKTFGLDATAPEQQITLENKDLRAVFTNRGGKLISAELRNYKTYGGNKLELVTARSSRFSMMAAMDGKEVDLFDLPYSVTSEKTGDSSRVVFTASTGDRRITHSWSLPAEGFNLNYKLETNGLLLQKETIGFEWTNLMPLVEKDMTDSRSKTAINFHTLADGTDGISETSLDPESMPVPAGTDWVGMKQKFFLSAILSTDGFAGGNIMTSVNPLDSQTVKTGNVSLLIPAKKVTAGGIKLGFYLGPNDYKTLGTIADGLEDNVYLGWPPVKQVNEYFIVPVFRMLTGITGNYGLIIIILVLVIRLVLLPLSYKSFLGMAKMRLLKPELDELKKKYPDDQVKFSQEQMKLFSEVGASPFSGCIPLLLQMPILFAMFYLFPSIIEFRQQTLPFAEDISTYDSVISFPFTIPFLGSHLSIYTLLMTISTLAITWQNNQMTTVDGPMKSLSYIMPVVFLFVLNSFPASLSFYYLAGNVASFGQQVLIRRFVDEDKIKVVMEEHRKKMQAGGGGKSKFMNRLNDALKASEEARKKNKRG